MAKTLSKTGITTSSTIESWHVSQSVDALTGTDAYDVTISGSLSLPGSTASGSFTGDGSGLTGITAEWDGSHNGNASITGSLTVTSNVSSSGTITGNVGTFTTLTNVNTTNITASGHVSSSATSTASFGTYLGDGSQLTGVTSEWDGTRNGNAEITGSLIVTSDISSSGIVYGETGSFSHIKGNSPITVGGQVTFQQQITASSDVTIKHEINSSTSKIDHNVFTATTSNNTQTTVLTIPIPQGINGAITTLDFKVQAIYNNGGSGAYFHVVGSYENNGTVTRIGTTPTTVVSHKDSTEDFTLTVSSPNVLARVTGIAATDINWAGVYNIQTQEYTL